MFFEVFEKKLAGDLDDENIVLYGYRLNGLEPGFVVLPLNDVFDNFQTIGPDFFSVFLHQSVSSLYIGLTIVVENSKDDFTGYLIIKKIDREANIYKSFLKKNF